jgi:hypothetical protein
MRTQPSIPAPKRDDAPPLLRATAAPDAPRTIREALPVFWRHASPWILATALAAAIGARLLAGGFTPWDLVPVAVVLGYWPFNEWLTHVLILHFKPFTLGNRTIDFRVPQSHRAHHRDPWDLDILFIPIHSFTYSLPLLVGLCFALAPTAPLALTALVAYLTLTLHYEWVHFLAHTRYAPRTAYYRRVLRNHRLHHFKNERYWFGVSMRGADLVLGTAPSPEDVATSTTSRTLGVAA